MRQGSSLRGTARRTRIVGTAVVAAAALLLSACSGVTGSGERPGSDGAPQSPASSLAFSDELTGQLREAVESVMSEYEVPGASVGVWVPGHGEWTQAFGVADLQTQAPVTLDMSWPIRSITKSYTVTLLLQLVDEGKVSLSDTLDTYLPGVTNGDQITLLQLANMSSGVDEYVDDAFMAQLEADPTHVFTLEELNHGVLGAPAQFAPGTQYVYTNSNTNLIGAVIEKVTGKPYAEVLASRILIPAGLANTQYIVDVSKWTAPHAIGYAPSGENGALEAQDQNPSMLGPAGALVSTLSDGHQWAQTLGSGVLLRAQTHALRGDGHEIAAPPYDLYGVGIGQTGGWFGHNGEGLGFTAATFYHPQSGSVIVVYMNLSNAIDGAHPADLTFRKITEVLGNSGM